MQNQENFKFSSQKILLIKNIEKCQEAKQLVSQIIDNQHSLNEIQNLYFRAITFVQREVYSNFSKDYLLPYEKIQVLAKMLIFNYGEDINILRKNMINILKYLYLDESISQKDICQTFQLLTLTIQRNVNNNQHKRKYIDYAYENGIVEELQLKSGTDPSKQASTKNKFQQQAKLQNALENSSQPSHALHNFQTRQEEKSQHINLKLPLINKNQFITKITEQWTQQEEEKLNQLYQSLTQNKFAFISNELVKIFGSHIKFRQEKVKTKIVSLMRIGFNILKEVASDIFDAEIMFPCKLDASFAKRVLQSRSEHLPYSFKKKILEFNFMKGQVKKTDITQMLQQLLEFLKSDKNKSLVNLCQLSKI